MGFTKFEMTNAIDQQIRTDIEKLSGYNVETFTTRFNDGAYDAYKVMAEIQIKYGRFITRDYTHTVLGIRPSRFQAYTQKRNKTAITYAV